MNEQLKWLLDQIGSWTNARWDQHLRFQFGDEKANQTIAMVENLTCCECGGKTCCE